MSNNNIMQNTSVLFLFIQCLREFRSTAVGQVVACAPVTQRARVPSPVGTSFLGEAFSVFFLTCKTNVRKVYAPKVPEFYLAIIIIINHHSFMGANDLLC